MSEEQIAELAYEYLDHTYWKSPADKAVAESNVLGFLDFMFADSEVEGK
jgi:hypothetical protein